MNGNSRWGDRGASLSDVKSSLSKGRGSISELLRSLRSSGAFSAMLFVCALVVFDSGPAAGSSFLNPAAESTGDGAHEFDAMFAHDASVLVDDSEPRIESLHIHPSEPAPAPASDLNGWENPDSCSSGECVSYMQGHGAPGCGHDCHDACCGPRWSVAVDALMLWQGNIESLPLFNDANGIVVLNANQIIPPMSAGPRFGLVRHLNYTNSIEGNYFNVGSFLGNRVLPAAGGPYTMTNLANLTFNDVESAQVLSNGRIQSAELNWRRCAGGPITWLVGFRWVEWNQQMSASYVFTNPTPFGDGSIDTAIGNNLYGGQVGADMKLWDTGGRFTVNGVGKAGIFYNSASYQRTTAGFNFSDGTPFPLGTAAASADQTSFFGEVGINSSLWLTRWLAWRVGYSLFWLGGVAVPAEQFPLTSFGPPNTASIDTNGSVLLHGVTTGIEARW